MYYHLRTNRLFPFIQKPWSTIVYSGNKYKEIRDNMSSLMTRISFLLKSYEKTAYSAYFDFENSSFDDILYNLGYFIMLCTGSF
jgi:site-specific DNA-adenine methylase